MIGRKTYKPEQDTGLIPLNLTPISKTVSLEDGTVVPGIDVFTHCLVTGFVAEELVRSKGWQQQKGVALAAACHDLGKISPDFQKMIYEAVDGVIISEFPELKSACSVYAKRKDIAFHAKVTQISLIKLGAPQELAIIEGMHHGFHPNPMPAPESVFGGIPWSKKRQELLTKLQSYFGSIWPDIPNWNSSLILGGLITVCDWIASGGEFSHLKLEDKIAPEKLREMAKEAVEQAGFTKANFRENLSFEDIFSFKPRDFQQTFYSSVSSPGVYILEAPMGMGKTEAALYAAYQMICKKEADGIYFALPTQLTSEKIHERVNSFLEKVEFPNNSSSLRLLHGNSWLYLGEDAKVGGSWFDGRKRGILAPFAVGTVDQALMAVMNVKHGMVRAFGLRRKVVILDEIHTYDSYTGSILKTLVSFLNEAAGCTVIILSATLTSRQKSSFFKGNGSFNPQTAYPLLTTAPLGETPKQIVLPCEEGRKIQVSISDDELTVIEEAIKRAENGEQVLWIENTVAEAQRIFKNLAARASNTIVQCALVHSRYTKEDRQKRESMWADLYGKDNNERYIIGRILVGTQVLEQSLDIDADFLVTRICPTDMILQRAGRLWRHKAFDEKRPSSALCHMTILSLPIHEEINNMPKPFGATGKVYSPYVLFRTLEQWDKVKILSLPSDVRPLLEGTYCERKETGKMAELKYDLQRRIQILENFAALAQSTNAKTRSDESASTRYEDTTSCKVLLLKSLFIKGDVAHIVFNNGVTIDVTTKQNALTNKDKIIIAKAIDLNSVSVLENHAPKVDISMENLFSPFVYTGKDFDEGHPFRAAIVGDDGMLKTKASTPCTRENGKVYIFYDNNLGYRIITND